MRHAWALHLPRLHALLLVSGSAVLSLAIQASAQAEQLSPDFAGIRPKLQRPGEPPRDFVIEEGSAHGAPGLVNLLGIESPGLTSALAIAQRVVELIG